MTTSLFLANMKRKKIFWMPILILTSLSITALLTSSWQNGRIRVSKSQTEYKKLSEEVRGQKERNKQLFEEIQRLKSDPYTLEKVAREEMQLANPNDIIIKTRLGAKIDPENATQPQAKK